MLGEIAAALPDVTFEVVGPGRDEIARAGAIAATLTRPNITIRGRVPRAEMASVYQNATALLCTSTYEGFPNTFLEAWGNGVPVVSTVDPDDLLSEHGLGLTAPDAAGLAAHLRQLIESQPMWRGIADRGRDYCVSAHAVDRALPRFEELFLDALRAEKARG